MQYNVVCCRGEMTIVEAIECLSRKVSGLLAEGWELQGGVSVFAQSRYFYASQAMIKRY